MLSCFQKRLGNQMEQHFALISCDREIHIYFYFYFVAQKCFAAQLNICTVCRVVCE